MNRSRVLAAVVASFVLAGCGGSSSPSAPAAPKSSCRANYVGCSADAECCSGICLGAYGCGTDKRPVANAGTNATVYRNAYVRLDGSASYDPDDPIIRYSWQLTKPAGSLASLDGPTFAGAGFTADREGTYVATLTVSDAFSSSTASVTITVLNRPPVANIGSNATVMRNTTFLVNGSASSDPDRDSLSYAWTLTTPAGSTATLKPSGSISSVYLTPDLLGDYGVTLTVSDGYLSSSASIVITAVNGAPVPWITAYDVANAGDLFSASSSGSNDPNGDPITYSWQLTPPAGSTSVLATPTAATTTFTPDIAGTYALTLTASDGSLTGTTTKQITIHPQVYPLLHWGVVDAVYYAPREDVVMAVNGVSYPDFCHFAVIARSVSCVSYMGGGTILSLGMSADGALAWGEVGAVGCELAAGVKKECAVTWLDGAVSRPFEAGSVTLGPLVTLGTGKNTRTTRFLHAAPSGTATGGKEVLSVDMDLCAVSVAGSVATGFHGSAALRPGTQSLYVLDGAGAGALQTWDTSVLPSPLAPPALATPDASPGDRFWFYGDGSRLVTSAGRVFEAAPVSTGTGWKLASAGLLGNPGAADPAPLVVHANPSAVLQRIAAIPATGTSATPLDVEVRQYASAGLAPVGTPRPLAPIVANGKVNPVHGRFVFYKADGTKLIVVEETSAADYRAAVYLMDP